MSLIDSIAMPGMGTVFTSTQKKLLRGYPSSLVLLGVAIDSAAVDSLNTPTTELRTGLMMAQITATGLYKKYDPTATNGLQFPVGPLWEERNMLDYSATARQCTAQIVIGGFIVASQIIGLDARARQLLYGRIVFDDMIVGHPPGFFGPIAKTGNYTVLAADSGYLFTNTGAAGAVIFTLPTTIAAGFRARFQVTADQNVTVAAPANKLITFNNLAATSVAFSTAGNRIGAGVEIIANEDATKYIAIPSGANTMTVA